MLLSNLKRQFFRLFQNKPLKYSSLDTKPAKVFENVYIEKLFNKISFEGRGTCKIVVTNRYGHKNLQ